MFPCFCIWFDLLMKKEFSSFCPCIIPTIYIQYTNPIKSIISFPKEQSAIISWTNFSKSPYIENLRQTKKYIYLFIKNIFPGTKKIVIHSPSVFLESNILYLDEINIYWVIINLYDVMVLVWNKLGIICFVENMFCMNRYIYLSLPQILINGSEACLFIKYG